MPEATTPDALKLAAEIEGGAPYDEGKIVETLRQQHAALESLRAEVESLRAWRAVPDGFVWPSPSPRRQSNVLFDDGYEEGWSACITTLKSTLTLATQHNYLPMPNIEAIAVYLESGNDPMVAAKELSDIHSRWKAKIEQAAAPTPPQAEQAAAAYWHKLYLQECQAHKDHAARLGAEIEGLEAEQAEQAGKRDREQDRIRFPDPDFNRWLDEAITENGEFTAWHALSSTGDAYAGWSVRPDYCAEQAGKGDHESLCQNCGGSGGVTELSDSSPDAYDIAVCCPHCNGSGALEDAYTGVVELLRRATANYYKALPYMVKVQNESNGLPPPSIAHPAPQPDDARDAWRWRAATDDQRIEGPAVCAWKWNGVDEVYQYRRLTRHEAVEAIDAALSAHEQKGGTA
jgi:hypothetical protein